MNIRLGGLLLTLVLTALPAKPAHAWAADPGVFSPAKSELKIEGIHESIGPFRPDDAASAGLSSGEPGMETLDLVPEPAPHQGAFFPTPPLIGTQRAEWGAGFPRRFEIRRRKCRGRLGYIWPSHAAPSEIGNE
jgi:hypothetical protein